MLFILLPSNYPAGLCHEEIGKECLHSQPSLHMAAYMATKIHFFFKQTLLHFLVSLPLYQLSLKWKYAFFCLKDLLHRSKFGTTLSPWWLLETDTEEMLCLWIACRLWLLTCIFKMLYSDLESKEISAVLSTEGLFLANISTLKLNWFLPRGKKI